MRLTRLGPPCERVRALSIAIEHIMSPFANLAYVLSGPHPGRYQAYEEDPDGVIEIPPVHACIALLSQHDGFTVPVARVLLGSGVWPQGDPRL
jgi:hypothetical protein